MHEEINKELQEGNKKSSDASQYMDSSSWFPEMNSVKPTGSLNPSDGQRNKVGKSYFHDGDLYSGFDFHKPEPKGKSTDEKHYERTSKFGKVYK